MTVYEYQHRDSFIFECLLCHRVLSSLNYFLVRCDSVVFKMSYFAAVSHGQSLAT